MIRANVDWTIEVYAGALHAFTQAELAGSGISGHDYDPSADQRSWRAMIAMLSDAFGH